MSDRQLVAELVHITGSINLPITSGIDSSQNARIRVGICDTIWKLIEQEGERAAEKHDRLFLDATSVNYYFTAHDMPHWTEVNFVLYYSAVLKKDYISSRQE